MGADLMASHAPQESREPAKLDAKRGGGGIAHLDGVRGALMVAVLLAHIFYAAAFQRGPMPWYRWMPLWFQPAMYAVSLFVVISGYCLMLSVVRTKDGTLSHGVKGYMTRRVRRILPPYYAALALSAAHLWLFRWVYADYGMPKPVLSKGVLLSHLLFYYNFNPAWRFGVNGAYWSLAPEWQLYVIFALVLVPLWRRFGAGWLLICTLSVSGGLMLLGPNVCAMHPWFLAMFAGGMVAAVGTTSNDDKVKQAVRRMPWDAISYVLLLLFAVQWVLVAVFWPKLLSYLPPTWPQYAVNETLLGTALIAGIFHWSHVERTRQIEEWPLVLRVLNDPQVQGLGRFSYSHYLVHFPIVLTVASVIRRLHLPLLPTLLLNYLVALPVSITLGYLFFLAVEKRCQPSYAKRRKTSTENGAALAA